MRVLLAALVLAGFASCARGQVGRGADSGSAPTVERAYALEDLEAMALQSHPVLAEASAMIAAAQGRAYQAGRPNNPRLGYIGEEIGNGGGGGQNGGFIGQTFIRGGKRRLDQAIACQDVQRLRHEYERARLRLLNGVRKSFYALLVLQRRIKIKSFVLGVSRSAAELQSSLAESGDILMLDAILYDIKQQEAETDLVALQAASQSQAKELAAAVGMPQMVIGEVKGDIRQRIPVLSYDEAHALVVSANPVLAATSAEIRRNQIALTRAQVEPTPDVNVQAAVQHGSITNNMFASVIVGVPVPIWDKNRGAIYEASSNVGMAIAKRERQRLELERQLAAAYREYHTAVLRAKRYETEIMPKAIKALDAARKLYDATEISLERLVEVQLATAAIDLQSLDASDQAWSAFQRMMSMLTGNDNRWPNY